jgi:hypothetical protein
MSERRVADERSWHDDATVTETQDATRARVREAEVAANAFESARPTRKSLLPELLAKAAEAVPPAEPREPPVLELDDLDVIFDEDELAEGS